MNIAELGLSLNETRKLRSNAYLTKNSEHTYTMTISAKPTQRDLLGVVRELNAEAVKNKSKFLDTIKLVFEDNELSNIVLNATSKFVLDIEKSNTIYVIDYGLVYYMDLSKPYNTFKVSAKSPSHFDSVNKVLFGCSHTNEPKVEEFTQTVAADKTTLMDLIRGQVELSVKAKNPTEADMWLNVAEKVSKRGW